MKEQTELDVLYNELCDSYRKLCKTLVVGISLGIVATILTLWAGVLHVCGNHNILAFLMFCLSGFDLWEVFRGITRLVQVRKDQKTAKLTYEIMVRLKVGPSDAIDKIIKEN